MMKGLIYFLVITSFISTAGYGQRQTHNWVFGYNNGISFNTGTPTLLNTQIRSREGCASISDTAGQLQFYTDGIRVWRRNHTIMPNGGDLNGDSAATMSALITEYPGNKDLYYIFTTDTTTLAGTSAHGFQWHLVDMSLNGGLGDVVSKNNMLLPHVSEKVIGIMHRNANDIWVVTHDYGNNQFVVYRIDCNGLNTTPVRYSLGRVINTPPNTIGYMKASPDGSKIATAGFTSVVEIFDFNNATGVISNPREITDNAMGLCGPYGLEFSPDSKLLYETEIYACDGAGRYFLHQFQIDAADIVATKQVITTGNTATNGSTTAALLLGPDSVIYVALDNRPYLAAITNPNMIATGGNSPGTNGPVVGFVDRYFDLNGLPLNDGSAGLPNMVAGYRRLLGKDSTMCDGQSYNISLANISGVTFLWDDGLGGSNRTYTSTGKHWVRITTATGCSYSDTVYLTFKPRPVMDLGPDQAICADKFPITLTQAQENGVTYTWSDGITNGTSFTVNAAGTYYVDGLLNGCTRRDEVIVTSKVVTSFDLGANLEICGNTPPTLTVTGAFATYSWSNGATTASIQPSTSGTYTVDATNAVGCTYTDAVDVLFKPNPVADIGTDQAICADKFPIVLTQTAVTGETYLWQDGTTNSNTFNVTGAGVYWVDVTLNGCTQRSQVSVTSKVVTTFDLGANLTICGNTPPTLTVSGAFASYVWSNGATTASIQPATSGTYSVDATNAVGCTFTDAVDVLFKPNPVVDIGTDQAICADKFPITLTQAQSAGLTYTWSTGANTNFISAPGAGTYWVDVTLDGCTIRDEVIVTSKAVTTFDLGPAITICGNTPPTINVTGAFASYLWSNGATTASIQPATSGTYTVDATNAVGCTFTDAVDVLFKPNPVVDIGTDQAICADKFPITLTQAPSAGLTYTWSTGANTNFISAPGAGTYWVDVTLDGCTIRDEVIVTSKAVTTFDLGPAITICGNTPPTLNVAGAFASYIWSNGATTASIQPATSGTYTVDATNAVGCTFTDAVDVLFKPNPVADIGTDQAICADKFPITLTQAPGTGLTYTWSTGANTNFISAPAAGTYWVDVTLDGCTIRDEVIVTSKAVTTFDLGPAITICGNTPPTINVTGAFASYLWSNGATTASIQPSTSGTYTVDATNAVGCTFTDAVDVLFKPNPVAEIGTDQSICADKFPITLTQAPGTGLTYTWNTGATTNFIQAPAAGIYWVDVTLDGCTIRDQVDITSRPVTTFDLGPDREICGTAAQILTVNPGFTAYAWSTGAITNSISVNTNGIYSVEAVNASGCSYRDEISVTFKPNPVVNIGADQDICADKFPVTLTQATIPGATYLWNTGATSNTLPAPGAGTYRIDVTLNGCTVSDDVLVTSKPVTSFTLGPDTSICGSPEVILAVPGTFSSYLWSTGSTASSININTTGNYWVEATNSFGCTFRDERAVTLNTALIFSLGKDTTLCPGTTLLLDVSNTGDTYTWQDNSTNPQFMVSTAGIYYVEVNKTGCEKSDTIVVSYSTVPQPNLGADMEICPGQQLILDPKVVGKSYLWSDGSRLPTLAVKNPGTYTIQIGSDCGITTDEIIISKGVCRLALPNAFTPDKAKNNTFRLINGYELAEFKMEIYNRWGQLIFLSQNPGVGWNGMYRGVVQPAGTYVYAVSYIDDATGKKVMQRGTVILIR